MKRLQMINMHAAPAKGSKQSAPKGKPTLNVWESMGLDGLLSDRAVTMRKETSKVCDEFYKDLLPHVEATTFPTWLPDKLKPLGINGLTIKGYGSPGLTTLEAGASIFELVLYRL